MIITKKVERLYSLKQYENIKVVYEATEDIKDMDPGKWYEYLSKLLREQIAKDARIINPPKEEAKKPTESLDCWWPDWYWNQ